jgi:hypothetical protein
VVGRSLLAHNQTRGLASIAELDNGVMAQTKALSHIADRRSHFVGGSSDLEEELMLLWPKTALLRRCLTEVEKQAELMAKFGEYLKSGSLCRHSFFAHYWSQVYRNTTYCGSQRASSECAFAQPNMWLPGLFARQTGDLAEYRNRLWGKVERRFKSQSLK